MNEQAAMVATAAILYGSLGVASVAALYFGYPLIGLFVWTPAYFIEIKSETEDDD